MLPHYSLIIQETDILETIEGPPAHEIAKAMLYLGGGERGTFLPYGEPNQAWAPTSGGGGQMGPLGRKSVLGWGLQDFGCPFSSFVCF